MNKEKLLQNQKDLENQLAQAKQMVERLAGALEYNKILVQQIEKDEEAKPVAAPETTETTETK
jgi:hypothetical protein